MLQITGACGQQPYRERPNRREIARRPAALTNMTNSDYPKWLYYPKWSEPPDWAFDLVKVFSNNRVRLDSNMSHNKSDQALAIIRGDLESSGYVVEKGEMEPTIRRPVHFGEFGVADRTYQIDSYHSSLKIALEIEAGRSTRGNAVYRDIVQTSLLVGVDYFALAVPQKYSFKAGNRKVTDPTYEICKSIFDAIYSSERLRLPLRGVLLIGY